MVGPGLLYFLLVHRLNVSSTLPRSRWQKALCCLQSGLLYPHLVPRPRPCMSTGSAKLLRCFILLLFYLIAIVHRGLKPPRTSTKPYEYPIASTCANVKNVLFGSVVLNGNWCSFLRAKLDFFRLCK